MRILTILSGILLAAGGGFCYYFSTNAFATLAFVLGALMAVSGIFTLLTYIVGLRNPVKLPETVFVEGLVTLLFGFAVLNNQISDAMLTIFFGTWLTLAGATRLSQSFSVSRHNARDWAKIIPVAILSIVGGVVLLMQKLVEAYNPVALVGTAFLLDALSQLLYALYMKPHIPRKRELEAKARVEAKEKAEIQKRRERNRLRKLSRSERQAVLELQRAEKAAQQEALREAGAREKAQQEASAGKTAGSDTISLSPQEVDEIREQTDEAYAKELQMSEAAPEETTENPKHQGHSEKPQIPEGGEEEETGEKSKAGEAVAAAETRPVWHRPTDIPTLRGESTAAVEAPEEAPAVEEAPVKVASAVNLEELEKEKEVFFEKIDLPEPEFAAKGGEASLRDEFLRELEKAEQARTEGGSFTAVSLEELVGENPEKSVSEKERTDLDMKLTMGFTFQWPKPLIPEDEK